MSSATGTIRTLLCAGGFPGPSCVSTIEKAAGRLDGVENVTVHFASGRIEIDQDEATTSVDGPIAAVGRTGCTSRDFAF